MMSLIILNEGDS